MVAATKDEVLQILLEAFRLFGVFYIEPQMIGIVIVTTMNTGRQRTIRLMNDRLYSVSGYDCPLRRPLDKLGGNNLLRHYNQPARRLRLLLVRPASSVDLTISVAVRNLHMNEGHVRRKRPQQDVLFPVKGHVDRFTSEAPGPASNRSKISEANNTLMGM